MGFIKDNMIVQRYIHEILEPLLLPYLAIMPNFLLQLDNSRPYVARVSIDFFQASDVNLLPWVFRSPESSPIKHI